MKLGWALPVAGAWATAENQARTAQHAAIDRIDAWGTTALHDSIIQSLDLIEQDGPARGRHALLLFSDGADRYSVAQLWP